VEPVRPEHPASGIEPRWTVRDAREDWSTSLRRPIQCSGPQSEDATQRLGKSRKTSHRWHRCQNDGCRADTLAEICDQLRQVACPTAGCVEPEHIIDTQSEHNDINRSFWNLGDKTPCHTRGCANLSNSTPLHCPARERREGGSNLAGKAAHVIRRANTRDGRLADHQKSQRDTADWNCPNRRTRRFWQTRRVLAHVARLKPQDW
jgi:hypothetical protein